MDKFKVAWPILRRMIILMLQADAMPVVDREKVDGFMADLDKLADADGDGIADAMEAAGEVEAANDANNPPEHELPPGYVWRYDTLARKWLIDAKPQEAPGHGFG